ncbi:MAG: ankyrin repeat domain-containing protein [Deltaproteobacteria bacterium]|nr:ankyrin repeat domain-containing protein [Deltaproteobacteria bacterium]
MKIRFIILGSLIFFMLLYACASTEKKAVLFNDLDILDIKNIVTENPSRINEKDSNSNSFLHVAVHADNEELVKFLISKGADVNIKNNYGQTPLQIAADKNNLEIITQLVSHDAEINIQNTSGLTPLDDAIHHGQMETVKYLISKGAEINIKDTQGKTPLHYAAISNKVEISKYLIEKGAEVNARDGDGKCSLHYMVIDRNLELFKLLISNGADVNTKDNFNRTSLHYAAAEGYLEIVKYLIFNGSEIDSKAAFHLKGGWMKFTLGCTPLHIAVSNGHLETVKYLISQGADIDLKNNEDENALDLAKKRKHQEIVTFLESSEKLAHLSKSRKTVVKTPVKQAPPKEYIKTKPRSYSDIDFGKYSALVIGNNNYKYLPQLKTAQNDAREVAEILKGQYGFKVKLLLDADRSEILLALSNLRWNLNSRDNLLIYYAGHGWLDEEADEGYWLPVNAQKDNMIAWISNSSITASLRALKAKHVLIVADSCYSGKLARGVHIVNKTPGYLSRLSRKRARCVISSGGLGN